MIKAHFFDMDHTLINSDCDVTWKDFTVKEKLSPVEDLKISADFFEDYNQGRLDFDKFMRFQLKEFIGKTPQEMQIYTLKHFNDFIKTKIYTDALNMVADLQRKNFIVGILTSTNTEIARPVAEYFNVRHLLGSELEIKDGQFTGKIDGIYAAQAGKVDKIKEFCAQHQLKSSEVAYYGDSINDRQILEFCGEAHAVNPSPALKKIAESHHWDIINFK